MISLAPDEGGPWTIAEDRGELWLRVRNSRYDPGTAAEHPPHSWAHRDFTARRLIRDVFAVRERLSDPRVVPSFRCTFLPDMPPSPTPGSRRHIVQVHDADMVFANGARHSPIPPQSVSRGRSFRGCTGSQLLRPVRLLASPDGSDRNRLPATGGFYVQAFDGAVKRIIVAGATPTLPRRAMAWPIWPPTRA